MFVFIPDFTWCFFCLFCRAFQYPLQTVSADTLQLFNLATRFFELCSSTKTLNETAFEYVNIRHSELWYIVNSVGWRKWGVDIRFSKVSDWRMWVISSSHFDACFCMYSMYLYQYDNVCINIIMCCGWSVISTNSAKQTFLIKCHFWKFLILVL